MLEALVGKASQRRKCRVADNLDAFLRARTSNERGWMAAADVDVFERLYWLDSHGNGTKLVHAVTCPGVGLDSSAQCRPGGKCRKRYVAASLGKGQVSKLKCAMIEQLGEHSDWDPVEQRGNPVASPLVRGYLANAPEEQRRGGVSVKLASPLVASRLRRLVIDVRRRVATLPTAAERSAMVRDVVIFGVAFHTMKRGFELSVAVAAKNETDIRRRKIHFQFTLWEESTGILSSGSGEEEHRLLRNLRGGRYDRVRTGRSVHAVGPSKGLRFSVPERSRKRREREASVDTSADDRQPPGSPACSGYGG